MPSRRFTHDHQPTRSPSVLISWDGYNSAIANRVDRDTIRIDLVRLGVLGAWMKLK